MIIEICGPPGVGKTTLARALTARLYQRGLSAELASSYRPSEQGVAHGPAWMGRGGIWDALHRLTRPAQELLASSYLLSSNSREATTAKLILSSLPPKSAIWTFRFRQYIWRFSHVWFGASSQNRIVIFDQAFVQLVCSLVLLGAVVNDAAVSRVLALIPRPDLLVRLTAPPQILQARLAERQRRQSWIERRLEFDLCTNLRAIEVFERLQPLLGQHGWSTMCVDATAPQTDRGPGQAGRLRHGLACRQSWGGMMRVAAARSSVLVHELVRATARMVIPEATSTYGVLTRRLARGSAAALAIYVLGAGVSYCAQILVARIIGADGYGVYAYVIAWMTILAYFSALGFDVSLLRFIPAYRAQQAPDLIQGVIRYAQRSVTAVGVGVALIGGATMMLARHHLSPALANTFLMGFAVVPIWALLWVRGSLVRAFGGVVSALVPDRIARDGLLLCVLLLAVRGLGWHPDAFSTIGVTVICSGMALYSVSFAANKLRSRELAGIRPTYERSRWLQSAAPLVMIATIEPLMNRTGVVLLGWAGDVKAAGIYAVAFNVSFLVMLPCTAVNVLFAPTAADLFARSDRAGLQSLVVRTAAWTLLSAISIALPLTILADPVLGLFGHDFTVGAGALRILLVGQVIGAGAGSLRPLMLMTGHERAAALLLALCAATGGLLGAVLIGPLGLAGAAVATALTLIFWNLAMGLFVWRHLRLLPGIRPLSLVICVEPQSSAAPSCAHPSQEARRWCLIRCSRWPWC